MLLIKRNEINNLSVTVSQHKTLASPYYLFSFQHIMSKETVRFFPKNISTATNRYDEFQFHEGKEPLNYTGDIPYEIFPFEGQYYYSIYECITSGNTNPQFAFEKLEEGRAFVEDSQVTPEYTYTYESENENNANYIYYTPGTNVAYPQIGIQLNTTNQYPEEQSWNYGFPSLYIQQLEQGGNIDTVPSCLYDETDGENCFKKASGDTWYQEIQTGSTWPGFKIYFDLEQVKELGYEFGQIGITDPTVTGVTYNNFTVVIEDLLYSSTSTEHYSDGTTRTSTQGFNTASPFILSNLITVIGNQPSCLDPRFLLQEDGDLLLQEDNSNIII